MLVLLCSARTGALSLWNAKDWQQRLEQGVRLIQSKLEAGRLEGRLDDVQRFGRLLSTRHRGVQLAGRGRLVIPEGFREFLGVEPGGEVMVIGAALCVELWGPSSSSSSSLSEMPSLARNGPQSSDKARSRSNMETRPFRSCGLD